MKMRKWFVLMFLIAALALAACGGAAEEPASEPAVEEEAPAEVMEEEEPAAEEPAAEEPMEEETMEEEPMEEEPMEEEMGEADLDGGFTSFLAGMEAYNTIGLDELNTRLVEGEDLFLLDVRGASELESNGWIEGAVHVPLREVAANVDKLPSFDTTIVSYCGSGWRCTIAITALEALGWEDALSLKGGSFGGWVEAGYPIVEGELPQAEALNAASPDPAMVAAMDEMLANVPDGYGGISAEEMNLALVDNPDTILIDVRRAEEVESKGYVDAENVLFIPLEEFIAMKDQWPADMDAPIIVYCGSGHRSTIAMSILWTYGYTDVHSLKGGYNAWLDGGFATVGAPEPAESSFDLDAAFNTFLADMERYNTIGLEDFNLLLIEDPPFVLDVREPAELEENGYIETAVNIPLRELGDNLDKLPSFDTPIVSYCGSGWRCTIALTALEALGWENVLGLKGGSFGGWVEAGYPAVEGLPPEPEVLDAVELDPAAVELIGGMLASVPDGFGVVTADDLNLALIENPDLILIDVRRLEEVEEKGIIEAENWIWTPLEEFVAMKDMWPADTEAPIVIYCGSGHRSTIAMSILWTYGYTDVLSLKGGFNGWADAGYPTVEYAP